MNPFDFTRRGLAIVCVGLLFGACQGADPTSPSASANALGASATPRPLSPQEQARREEALSDTYVAAVHNLRGTLLELAQRKDSADAIRAVKLKISELENSSAEHRNRARALRAGG